MTNQNPAMSSKSPQDRRLQHDILAKVNAHADRSMDRLFADIEELLGDEPNPTKSTAAGQTPAHDERYGQQQSQTSTYPPQSAFPGQRALSPDSSYTEAPAPNPAAKPTKRVPFWLKALLGISITSIAAGSLGFWLVNERKVVLPQIDTSWLPFQSRVAPADAKFADYMRKSLAKIDAAPPATTTPAATPFNPSTSNIAPPGNPTAIAPVTTNPAAAPTKTIVTGTATPIATPVTNKIALVKTLQTGARPEAVFQIDGRTQSVRVGQKIGTSNWSLLTVAKGEVILKRKGGEIRSVYVGQKF
jgi:Tfp pilus assembly protein PilP